VAVDRSALDAVLAREWATWGVEHGGCAVLDPSGVIACVGSTTEVLPWASVTKIVSSLAVLDVIEDGLLDLDSAAGPPGATVRHLLAHASGLAFDEDTVLSAPGTRRIYSNVGIDTAVAAAVQASGARDAAELLASRVLEPLAMDRTVLVGPASHGLEGPLDDLIRLAAELLVPRVLRPWMVASAIEPAFPGLAGVLPGFGRQDPNDWGLGIELRDGKSPHWTPACLTATAFGHFGQSGSFLWVDRELGLAAGALTGTPFGPWAADAWPRSMDEVIRARAVDS
jgi:CubicO group peptidase (beta-lactamase class C family)